MRSIDLERLPEVCRALAAWIETVRQELRLEEVYLHGSFARGKIHEGSDIDVVLIGPFEGKLPYRIARVLGTTDLPIEPLCYTREEWQEMVRAGNSLALEVERTGRRLSTGEIADAIAAVSGDPAS